MLSKKELLRATLARLIYHTKCTRECVINLWKELTKENKMTGYQVLWEGQVETKN